MQQNLLDLRVYSEMKDIMEEVLPELLKTFINYMPDLLNDLNKAIAANEPNQLFSISHRMKSSCNSLGALGIARTCESLEMIGRAGNTNGATKLSGQLKEELTAVLEFFEKELKALN